MPVKPIRFSLWWLAGLVGVLILIYLAADPFGFTGRKGDRIGVVEVLGVMDWSDPVVDQLVELSRDDSIKVIIIRIDSPGGGVAVSQEIHREIQRTRKKKKVIASMGSVAASGGYYIAAGTDKIVANPGTTTGSIGVIIQLGNVEDLLSKVGLRLFAIKSGSFKDTGSPSREMTLKERALLQSVVDDMHAQFIDVVVNGRDLDRSQVEKLADGRIMSGRQALELGLVDEMGSFRDAVSIAAKMAGISGPPELVFPGRKESGLLTELIRDAFRESAQAIGLNKPKFQLGL